MIDTLLLVGDRLPDTTREAVIHVITKEVKANPADEQSVTANLVWIVKNTIRFALYKNDRELLKKAFDRIGKETDIVTQLKDELEWRDKSWRSYVGIQVRDPMIEGIQIDYSNLTHGPLLYTGGYGQSLIKELSEILYDTRDTCLFPERAKKVFVDYLLEHVRWVVRGKTIDYSTMGREVALNNGNGTSDNAKRLKSGLKYLVNTPGIPRKEELEIFAKKMAKQDGVPDLEVECASAVLGNRSFWKADYMAHHTERFFVSVRMSSNRTIASEIVNWENRKGDYLGDGVTYIYRTGEEYHDVFGAWDWAKIPGATIMQKPFEPVTRQHVAISGSMSDFGGTASDGKYGVAAMELVREALYAKKAWFLFDKELVALGTDINCLGENKTITSVNQCILKGEVTISQGGDTRVLERGSYTLDPLKWMHHDDIGYTFADETTVHIQNDRQSGDLSTVSGRNSESRMVHQDIFSIWFDHGTHAVGQKYQYTVVPGIAKEELDGYVKSNRIQILQNTSSIQSVWNEDLQLLQVVFWQKGTVTTPRGLTVEVDQACLLMLQKEHGRMQVTISSPEHKELEVKVTMNLKLLSEDVVYDGAKGTSAVIIRLPDGGYAGKSITRVLDFVGKESVIFLE